MPIGQPKYLAITIAGAVSLGSYEAGAMYEILDAIRQHNEKVVLEQTGQQIFVDVITGASAGGMTASILAQKLLFEGPAFAARDNNPLYNTWVKGIDLVGLMNTEDKPIDQGGDPAELSLLSSALIEQIARNTLEQCGPDGKITDLGVHAAVDVSHGIKLGLALTNLNGIDYGSKMFDGAPFQYTDFSDQMVRSLTRASTDCAIWQELGKASVACGAFPAAFRTKDLLRKYEDYKDGDPLGWNEGDRTFTYTDGGVLQNQPLGMAKNLVDLVDQHFHSDRRFYLFVSPHAMENRTDVKLREASATIFDVLERLISVYMGQAMFRDWVQAEGINVQVALLDQRAAQLASQLAQGTITPGPLSTASEQILNLLYDIPNHPENADSLQKDVARLQIQYAAEVKLVGGLGDPRATALIEGILVLEKTAELGEREIMKIYGVVIDPAKLAGAGIASFVGFFDLQYRIHDYEWGRLMAQQLLSKLNAPPAPGAKPAPSLGPIDYISDPVTITKPDLDGLKLKDIFPSDKQTFREGLKRRVNQMLSDRIDNWLGRKAAQFAADSALELLLEWELNRDAQG